MRKPLKSAWLLWIILVMGFSLTFAVSWQSEIDVSASTDTVVGAPAAFSLALDDSGNAAVVYGKGNNIEVSNYTNATWSTPSMLSDGAHPAGGSAYVVSDSAGNMIAFWTTTVNTDVLLHYKKYTSGGSWGSDITLATVTSDNFNGFSVAMDRSSGHALAAWITNTTVWVSIYNGTSWSSATNIYSSGANLSTPSVAMGSSGQAVVVWADGNGSPRVKAMRYTGGWNDPVTTLSTTGHSAVGPVVGVDSSGNVYALWQRSNGSHNIIEYANYPNAWGNDLAITLSDASYDASIPVVAMGTNGHVFAAWQQATGGPTSTVFVASNPGSDTTLTGWTKHDLNLNNTNIITGLQIATNGSQAIASWAMPVMDNDVRASYFDGSSWGVVKSFTNTASSVMALSAVAMNVDGVAAVSWIRENTNTLNNVVQSEFSKLTLTVTATDQSMTVGTSVPPLTYTISGFTNGDTSSIITGSPTLSVPSNSGSSLGDHTISVNVDGMSSANNKYGFTGASGTLHVLHAQTITFDEIDTQYYGTNLDLTGAASCTSADAITYSVVSGPASISGNTLTFTGVGTVTVAANRSAIGTYAKADQVTQDITVAKADQTITFGSIGAQSNGGTYDLSSLPAATSTSGLTVSYTVASGPANLHGTVLHFTGSGTVVVHADQAGDRNHNAATQASHNIVVNAANQTITFGSIPDQTYGGTYTLAATSDSGLSVTYTVSGAASLDGHTLTFTGVGTEAVTVVAHQAGNDHYNAASTVTQHVTVAKANQTITFADLGISPQDYEGSNFFDLTGHATSDSGLTVSYGVSGPATLSGNHLTFTGAEGTVIITASQTGDSHYNAATSVTQSISIVKTNQTITFGSISAHTVGQTYNLAATSDSDLTVSYEVEGPATLSGHTLTFTGTGVVAVTASQAGDGSYNPATPVKQEITVNPGSQTITFGSIANQHYKGTYTLGATSNSGLPVSYSVTGPANFNADTGVLTFTNVGTVTVIASQAGSTNYDAATSVTQNITVGTASQTITFSAVDTLTCGSSYTLHASSDSGLAVTFSVVSGRGSISGNVLTVTGVGTVRVGAHQAGSDHYSAASQVNEDITVTQGDQAITFGSISDQVYHGTHVLSATSSSGLAVTFSVIDGPATLDGHTLTFTGLGTVTVAAMQAGNDDYKSAPQIRRHITVNKATQTLTVVTALDTISPGHYEGSSFFDLTGSITSSSGLDVSYTLVSGPATLTGNHLTFTGAAQTVTVVASQAGDSNYYAATSITQEVVFDPVDQTITFDYIRPQRYGTVYTLAASSDSNLPITYHVVSGPASLSNGRLTFTDVGTVVVSASQGGSVNYNAATSISHSITVNAANQTITFGSISSKINGATYTLSASSDSGLAVSYSVSGPATLNTQTHVLTFTGTGVVTVTATQAGNNYYNSAPPVTRYITVTRASQTITFGSISAKNAGATYDLTASSDSGLDISYSVSGPATHSGSQLTFTGAGTVIVTANQAGNSYYNPATSVTQHITVNPAS